MINVDEKLKELFDGESQISMFDLAKIVNLKLKAIFVCNNSSRLFS